MKYALTAIFGIFCFAIGAVACTVSALGGFVGGIAIMESSKDDDYKHMATSDQ